MKQTYAATRKGYANLWEEAQIKPAHRAATKTIVNRLTKNLGQYQDVAMGVGCSWWFVAIIHQLESSGDFKTYLHNGDPLARSAGTSRAARRRLAAVRLGGIRPRCADAEATGQGAELGNPALPL